jgi:hypothetical protein
VPRRGFAEILGWFPKSGRRYPCCRRGSPHHRTYRSGCYRENRSSVVLQHLSATRERASDQAAFITAPARIGTEAARDGSTVAHGEGPAASGTQSPEAAGPEDPYHLSTLLRNCGIGPALDITGDPTVTPPFFYFHLLVLLLADPSELHGGWVPRFQPGLVGPPPVITGSSSSPVPITICLSYGQYSNHIEVECLPSRKQIFSIFARKCSTIRTWPYLTLMPQGPMRSCVTSMPKPVP